MLYSKKLSQFKNLIHGFTTRGDGDFREGRDLTKTAREISQSQAIARLCVAGYGGNGKLILPEQVHGDKIAIVDKKNKKKIIKGVDGLITKEKGIVLGITTADCLPILFYEPERKIAAAVHAGWKGSLKRISQKAAQTITRLGGNIDKIIVVIGPHIKSCCYDIDEKRANSFKKEFGSEVRIKRNDNFFLDLTKVNLIQLLESGVKEENIEILPYCTYCHSDVFFSFRKSKDCHGEMLSFIVLK